MDEIKFTEVFDVWPLPAILADNRTGRIIKANQTASQLGLSAGALSDIVEHESAVKSLLSAGMTPANHQANIVTGSSVQVASTVVRRVCISGQDMQLIVITSMKEPGQDKTDILATLCETFAGDQKNALRSFLQASAMDVGAFSAAVYEKRKERYII
ncbi:MAG: hypothetical protein GXW96_06020, partial [Christensenellaceae bacterium]|nr:hypothetical protein [Christensenellaceae bacterium]